MASLSIDHHIAACNTIIYMQLVIYIMYYYVAIQRLMDS